MSDPSHPEGPQRPANVVRQVGQVGSADRARLFGQRPATVWFTGLPGSGKTTLAFELERSLFSLGRFGFVLDGDNIRQGLCADLGFGPEDRRENIRRVAEVAKLMNDAGLIAISAFISPYAEDRRMARKVVGAASFLEIYLSTSLEACEKRDPKGLYALARSGEIASFTGVSAPYEPPADADIVIDTAVLTVEACVRCILGPLLAATGAPAGENVRER